MDNNFTYNFYFKRLANSMIAACAILFLNSLNGFSQSAYELPGLTFQKGPSEITSSTNLDAAPPVINYTPLVDTCFNGNRKLIATITDADGVPTSGSGLPVLYWQINSGPYSSATGVSLGSNQYSFTFGTGASSGSLVSYFIVAQDNVGNVIAKPSAGAGGYSTNPPAAATSPSAPSFYVIQTTLAAGTYNVGAGQTYITITDAINAYNNSCLGGAITFLLTDPAYDISEIFPLTIYNPGASAVNTLTIKPNTGLNATIQGTSVDAIFKLNGADYITIEGSNSGGVTRNLTILNNSTNPASSVIWVASSGALNGATHNTVKNCNINGNGTNTTFAALVSSSGITAGQPAEAANSFNSYINNSLTTTYNGLLVIGPTAGETGTVISNNTIGSTSAAKKLGYRGLVISNQSNVQVNNNNVIGIVSSIGLGSDVDPTAGIVVSGAISGGNIYSNNINDIRNTNSSGWPSYGISLQSASAAAGLKVFNNFIYAIIGYGNGSTIGSNGNGISILSGGGYGIFFNSVHHFTNQTLASGGISACLYIAPGVTGTASLDIRDNIFSNRRSMGTNYAVYSSVPVIVISSINYNDYYSSGFLGYLGANKANIAAWQAATGMDGNSVAANPVFVSAVAPIDLHLNPISPLNDQGLSISGITTDIDGVTRSATPDIGADEFTPPNCSGNSGGTVVSDFITVCTSGSVVLSATGFSYGVGISYQWQSSIDNTNWNIIAGETNPISCNAPVISATTWYRLKVTCSLTGGSPGYSNSLKVTVYTPAILTKTNGSRCGPGTVNLAATGSPTTAIQWYTTLTGGAPVYTGSPFTTPVISATTTYYVESTFLGSSGTAGAISPVSEGGTISTQLTSWEVFFNVIQATKLLTVDVYPLASGENSVIDVYNSSGTIVASVPYTTLVSGGATAQTVTMNVSLVIGNGYYLYATNGLPPTGLSRNITGGSYPYSSSDIQITGNGFLDPNFYMCYYNWRFSNGCSSDPRTAVVATIGASTPVTISASPASICAGDTSILTASSTNTAYTYSWTPGPVAGASISVAPATTTTYTYTAVDGACTSTGSVIVTVKPSPSNVVITPGPTVTKCASAPAILLTATGGNIAGVPVLNENFNGAGLPAGWTTSLTGSTGNTAASAWTLRANNYSWMGNTFRSNDLSQFYLSNSGANTGITNTILSSPAFSLVGYTSATLSFWHYFGSSGDKSDSIEVDISQNGTTWAPVYSTYLSRGISTINWANQIVNLNAYAGLATNYIRFRYYGTYDYQWALDNVTVAAGNGATPITWSPVTGLYTNSSASIAYTGSPSTATVYAKPSATTTYRATANPVNGCPKSDTVRVILRSLTAAVSADVTSVCPSGTANISITLNGTGPWSLTYTDGVLPVTVNNIATSPYSFIVNPLITTTYTLTALSDTYCMAVSTDFSPASVTVNVSATANSTWLGINNDWLNPLNWCGGVPTATKNVVIPAGPTIFPVITTLTPVGKDITIGNGASITINGGAKLSVSGNFTNNGTLTNYGTLTLNGTTAQSFPGGTTGLIASFNNLEVNNAAGATINKSLTMLGTLKPVAGTISLNNATITLHSDASGTARVDVLGPTAGFTYITGKFIVERYISSLTRTAWRFISAPISGTQTINQAWQEGQAPGVYTPTGYGMQIVGPSSAGAGFDLNNIYPSLKVYNYTAKTWKSVAGTTGKVDSLGGYMAFVRGDRGATTFGAMRATTLRVSGPIKTGNVGPIATTTASGFISAGNPYPSAIDFTATTRNGLQNTYYLWDPKLGTYGGYQTFTGPLYTATPGGGSYTTNKVIESGSAFFVVATAAAVPHNISFTEASKVAGGNQVQKTTTEIKGLRTQLSGVATTGINLIDGVLVEFDAANTNEIDDLDAPKLTNFGENISIASGTKLLSVERHADLSGNDTIFYQLGQLKQQQYILSFIPQELSANGFTAFIKDKYLNTISNLSLETATDVSFTVNTDPASAANDRFYVFFKKLSPVPVLYTLIQAYPKEKNIEVSWQVENQLNIDHYDIEKSGDGRSFTVLGEQAAISPQGSSVNYKTLDKAPYIGPNYYRIAAVSFSTSKLYSSIVMVKNAVVDGGITISPNPVVNNMIGVNFINEASGQYILRLFTANGQLVMSKSINHLAGADRAEVFSGVDLSPGLYNLEILAPTKLKRRRVYQLLVK